MIAIWSASCTNWVPRWVAMAQPTTRRLQTSSTTARYSGPTQVVMYVISANHNWLGPSALKSGCTGRVLDLLSGLAEWYDSTCVGLHPASERLSLAEPPACGPLAPQLRSVQHGCGLPHKCPWNGCRWFGYGWSTVHPLEYAAKAAVSARHSNHFGRLLGLDTWSGWDNQPGSLL